MIKAGTSLNWTQGGFSLASEAPARFRAKVLFFMPVNPRPTDQSKAFALFVAVSPTSIPQPHHCYRRRHPRHSYLCWNQERCLLLLLYQIHGIETSFEITNNFRIWRHSAYWIQLSRVIVMDIWNAYCDPNVQWLAHTVAKYRREECKDCGLESASESENGQEPEE